MTKHTFNILHCEHRKIFKVCLIIFNVTSLIIRNNFELLRKVSLDLQMSMKNLR